jgi:hypothetical protein
MEVVRRMSNTDRKTSPADRAEILIKFASKMADSGYGASTRLEVIKSGTSRYYRMIQADITGTRRLHRSSAEMKDGRTLKPLHSRKWFCKRVRGGVPQRTMKDNPWNIRPSPQQQRSHNKKKGTKHISRQPKTIGEQNENENKDVQEDTSPKEPRKNSDNHENITEATIFVPATPRSALKEALQKADDIFTTAHGQ